MWKLTGHFQGYVNKLNLSIARSSSCYSRLALQTLTATKLALESALVAGWVPYLKELLNEKCSNNFEVRSTNWPYMFRIVSVEAYEPGVFEVLDWNCQTKDSLMHSESRVKISFEVKLTISTTSVLEDVWISLNGDLSPGRCCQY